MPSGASTGKHEAVELRDGDPGRYAGKGVLRAVSNAEGTIASALRDINAEDQTAIDRRMIELDGTPDKSRLGANAILGVSCASARAIANWRGRPLWRSLDTGQPPRLPIPMVNILSGGLHAGNRIEVQDFLAVPRRAEPIAFTLEALVAIHRQTRDLLNERGYPVHGVADEGGWGPALDRNETGLELLAEAIARLGLAPRFAIALDIAASHFYRDGAYHLASERRVLTPPEMIDMLQSWCDRYPVVSIEDGLDEDDWDHWQRLTETLGARVQLIGDDLFTTNPLRLRQGIECKAANAVLIKMNQIGTLTETFDVVRIAREAGYGVIVSARSGETEDSFLADLAVACGADRIKIGSVTRSERLAKYNRLLEIEARELTRAN